jgi:uncharacterized repeat protein (TIGR01451 family)
VLLDFSGKLDEANALAIQTDGKIVAAGYTQQSIPDHDFAIARFLYDSGGSELSTDLSLTQTVSPALIAPGGLLTYTLGVHNRGPGAATDVVVLDALPTVLTVQSASADAGGSYPDPATLSGSRFHLSPQGKARRLRSMPS